MSTDLVPVHAELEGLDLKEIEAMLALAVEAGEVDGIGELAERARAQRAYDARRGLLERADEMAALTVRCEASLGVIDGVEFPSTRGVDPMVVGGREMHASQRGRWRALGAALDRGFFDELLARRPARSHGYSRDCYLVAIDLGVAYVPTEAMRGLHLGPRRSTLIDGRVSRITWWKARALAIRYGIEPTTLPCAPPSQKRRARTLRWLNRERKPTGSAWDKAYAEHRKTLAVIADLAPGTVGTKWDKLYEHLYAVETLIAREMKRGS